MARAIVLERYGGPRAFERTASAAHRYLEDRGDRKPSVPMP